MRKIIIGLFTVVIIAGMGAFAWKACAAEEPPEQAEEKPAGGEAAGGGDCCKADDNTPPLDLIKATPKGGLHNPYNDKIAESRRRGTQEISLRRLQRLSRRRRGRGHVPAAHQRHLGLWA